MRGPKNYAFVKYLNHYEWLLCAMCGLHMREKEILSTLASGRLRGIQSYGKMGKGRERIRGKLGKINE